jgi:hypothetical protein
MSSNLCSQNLDWSYKLGGSNEDQCYDIETSRSGDIYLTGGICNSVDFDVKFTSKIISAQGINMSDIFIAIYDSNMD